MNRQLHELDRLIDALNADRDPNDIGPIDSDLTELVHLARGLKELGDTGWMDDGFPTRAAIHLSSRLNPTSRVAVTSGEIAELSSNGYLPPPAIPAHIAKRRSSSLPPRQPWARKWLEIAASIVVLIVFTGLVALLLKNVNTGSSSPAAQSTQETSLGPVVATSIATAASTLNPTPESTRESSTPQQVSDPLLISLQKAAAFDLLAPVDLPNGLRLARPEPPMSLPGFTSVVLKYLDASGKEALTITEASPYQDSRDTMPADIWNNAVPVDLGNSVTGRLYQSDNDAQLWWQRGPTSIRLESGGAPGTTMLTKDQLLAVAHSMVPVAKHAGDVVIPSGAKVSTSGQAVAQARMLISSLGGNTQATASNVMLAALSTETGLGMRQPTGLDANAPIWSVEFQDGLSPHGCPDIGASVCGAGQIVVVVDAGSGNILGYHGQDGAWKQP